MKCIYCNHACVKAGLQRTGVQKYRCKSCKRYQQGEYKSFACHPSCNEKVRALLVEGISLRGIARLLQITLKAVMDKIRRIGRAIQKPIAEKHGVVEIDELWTYVGTKEKELWITYSLHRSERQVIDFRIGARSKANIQRVTGQALATLPVFVCTDGLNCYRSLIPKKLHKVGLRHTRRIERFNLNLRTHLKRLSRKTICFSRSVDMLEACLRIYFWGLTPNPSPGERGYYHALSQSHL